MATLLVSPLSWGHHYLIAAPGFLFVPLWFLQHGRIRFAKSLAVSACGLLWAHYLLLDWTGRAGLLGLGTTAWFLGAAIGLLQWSATEKAAKSDSVGSERKPDQDLRAA